MGIVTTELGVIGEHEAEQVERADASGRTPVVFSDKGWHEVADTALDFVRRLA